MKVVIVGGGTAGWLAALFVANHNQRADGFKPYDITVIESSKIPIIGAGEGSTGILLDTINRKLKKLKGLSERDFVEKCNATVKLGVHCKDWNGDGKSYFEPLQPTQTFTDHVDIDFLLATVYSESHNGSITGPMWEQKVVPFYTNNFTATGGYSYHFDAHLVGQYFKEVALLNGVKFIDAEVHNLDVNPNTGNLESVELKETGEVITGDLWFDCTGFKKLLTTAVGNEWVSYKKWLPVNKALTYFHPYEENEQISPETLALALPNGWMWQIPTQERYGCGYVYSDKFITDEQALDELKTITGRDIKSHRVIEFEPGRLRENWTANVVAAGLSSNFLEPLEATSIHSTIVALDLFTNHYMDVEIDRILYPAARRKYNKVISNMMDSYKGLIQLHYMTKREDSEFWKYCKYDLERLDDVKDIMEICEYRSPSFRDFDNFPGSGGWGVISYILTGLDILTKRVCADTLWNYDLNTNSDMAYSRLEHLYQNNVNKYYTHNQFIEHVKRKKSKNPFEGMIIEENFFDNVDEVRQLSLDAEFISHLDASALVGWRGFRAKITKEKYPELTEYITKKVNSLSTAFADKKLTLYFHLCLEETKALCHPSFEETKMHKDPSNWAGVIYLTPNPKENCGTLMCSDDMSECKHIDNVYNRLIIYPSDILHGPNDFFGKDINDGRMTVTIFAEK